MKESIIKFITDAFSNAFSWLFVGDAIADAMGGGQDSMSIITQGLQDTIINDVIPGMQAVGISIACAFFLIALLELAQSERLTLEYFVKFFSKFVIAWALVSTSGKIVQYSIWFGNALMREITALFTNAISSGTTRAQLMSDVSDFVNSILLGNPGSWILLVMEWLIIAIVFMLMGLILRVVVYIIGFTRILELNIRGAFMPVALGMIADDGWRGSAGRYIKKFIAVCAQGAILSAIGGLSNAIMINAGGVMISQLGANPDQGTFLGSFVIMIGVAFGTISIMFKSMGIVNDVFGA